MSNSSYFSKFALRFSTVPLLLLVMPTGCSSQPAGIEPIRFNARTASAQAIELYDRDGDGMLNDEELASVPGILKYKDKYDTDGDGMVSRQEIADRINSWSDNGVGFRTLKAVVLLDKRPLSGATVRFVPEPYLGDAPKVATGTTDGSGTARISVDVEHIPEDLRAARMRGMFAGTYKIEVTHPSRNLPERYTTGQALGEEVARDTFGDRVELELESR